MLLIANVREIDKFYKELLSKKELHNLEKFQSVQIVWAEIGPRSEQVFAGEIRHATHGSNQSLKQKCCQLGQKGAEMRWNKGDCWNSETVHAGHRLIDPCIYIILHKKKNNSKCHSEDSPTIMTILPFVGCLLESVGLDYITSLPLLPI